MCRLQCAQAVARSYQALQPQAEALDQLRIVHSFINSFDADAYVKEQRPVKQLRQDIMLLRKVSARVCTSCSAAVSDPTIYVQKPNITTTTLNFNLCYACPALPVESHADVTCVRLSLTGIAAVIESSSTACMRMQCCMTSTLAGRLSCTLLRCSHASEQTTAWEHPLSSNSSW